MNIDVIIITILVSLLGTTLMFLVRANLEIRRLQKFEGYKIGAYLAVGKLKKYIQEHGNGAEQLDKVFRAIECYAPEEDKKALRNIFYGEE